MNFQQDDDGSMAEEYVDEAEYEESDLRQSSAGALVRMAKRTGGWAENTRSLNFKDVTVAGAPPANWTAPLLLNGLVPGTGAEERIGRQIVIKTIRVRYQANGANRFVLVYDAQSNGAAPAITDIFQTNTFGSEINWSNRDRFSFIADLVLPIKGDAHTEFDLDCDLEVYYNAGTAGTVADIATGALYFLTNDSGAGLGVTYQFFNRIEYEE